MTVRKQEWEPTRGEKDAQRHRDLVKEEVKKRAIDTIANTPVIGRSGKIKVKIKGKKSYYFRFNKGGEGGGFGQGEGDEGDVVGRRPIDGEGGEGEAGDEAGEWELETEIDLAEIFEWLAEELGLPKLKKREGEQIEIRQGWKPSGVKRTGIPPRLKKKLTIKQAIKRNAGVILGLKELLKKKLGKDPNLDDEFYFWAWAQSGFNRDKAIELLQEIASGKIKLTKKDFEKALIYLDNVDLRYKKFEEDIQYESNAVIIAIMDVSGSMSDEKKLIARSFYWWAFNFLRAVYEQVKIVFIIHHTEAKVVSEEEFFHTVESGGTCCASGYKLAKQLIERDYPPESWNIYVVHFSDGEDFYPIEAAKEIEGILPFCNAVGYGEVLHGYGESLLHRHLTSLLKLKKEKIDKYVFHVLDRDPKYFVAMPLEDRTDIWPFIKVFFRKEEVK